MKITPEMVEYTRQLKAACGKINPDIAEEAFMSTSSVQRYINGDIKEADPEAYRRLILALGGDPDMVFNPAPPAPSADLTTFLSAYDARHEKEIVRLNESHQQTVDVHVSAYKNKDKWVNRLFVLLIIAVVAVIVLLIWALKLDSMLPDFGMIQY